MKAVVVVTSSELKEAVRLWLRSKRETAGLVVAQIAMVADLEADDEMAIRAQAVCFDTANAANEYLNPPKNQPPQVDQPKPSPVPEEPKP